MIPLPSSREKTLNVHCPFCLLPMVVESRLFFLGRGHLVRQDGTRPSGAGDSR